MSEGLKEALWWTVVFLVIAIVIAAGVRIVSWITVGEDDQNVWKVALLLIGASGAGGKAVSAITKARDHRNGEE